MDCTFEAGLNTGHVGGKLKTNGGKREPKPLSHRDSLQIRSLIVPDRVMQAQRSVAIPPLMTCESNSASKLGSSNSRYHQSALSCRSRDAKYRDT